MKKRTAASKSVVTKKRRKSPSPETISRRLNKLLGGDSPYKLKYLTYSQAREFCHQFIDSLLIGFRSVASEHENERFTLATKEILLEILKEKYQMPTYEAAILLLHAGIEMLDYIDNNEGE